MNHNTALTYLDCSYNQLIALDVGNNTALDVLYCAYNQLTALDVNRNTALTYLYCDNNQLIALDVSHNTALTNLDCYYNQLTALDVSKNTALTRLECHCNRLTTLDVSNNTVLEVLKCDNNQLTAFDVSHDTALTWLDCSYNKLIALDVSKNTALWELVCYSNQFTELDVSNCPENISINCDDGVTIIRENAKDKPSITTTSLKTGTIGKSYNVTLKGKGTKPLTWSATGLPSGLKFSEKGKISGKPTEFGTFNVKFTLSNGAGSTTKELTLTIEGIPPKLSGSLAKAELSVPYSSGLKLTKGSQPVTWSITGNLPEGLSFNTSTGVISGTPMSYKSSGFKLKITASNGAGKASKSVKLKVKGTKPKITTTLSSATQGRSYSAKLTATGSSPITWNVENLPEGLTHNGDTISGTPTGAAKSCKVKLTASNPVKSAKKTVTLKVIVISDTRLPAMSETVANSYSFAEHSVLPDELTLANSGGYVIVAVLPEISVDVAGMYDFDVALSDDVPEGADLVYLANSDSPSDDDEIAEFYDDECEPITAIPEDRRITISIWLNKNTVYKPTIAIKQ